MFASRLKRHQQSEWWENLNHKSDAGVLNWMKFIKFKSNELYSKSKIKHSYRVELMITSFAMHLMMISDITDDFFRFISHFINDIKWYTWKIWSSLNMFRITKRELFSLVWFGLVQLVVLSWINFVHLKYNEIYSKLVTKHAYQNVLIVFFSV